MEQALDLDQELELVKHGIKDLEVNISEILPLLIMIQCIAFSGGGQSGGGPMQGMAGMGLGALPMNPALVAAALNQAGWGLISNLGGGGGPGGAPAGAPATGEHGAFPTPTSFPATVAPGPTTVANSGTNGGNGTAPTAGFLGWGSPGAADQGVAAGAAAATGGPQTTPPQHGPAVAAAAAAGTWSNQPRDRQGSGWKYME